MKEFIPFQEGVTVTCMNEHVVVWRDYICRHGIRLRVWINAHHVNEAKSLRTVLLPLED